MSSRHRHARAEHGAHPFRYATNLYRGKSRFATDKLSCATSCIISVTRIISFVMATRATEKPRVRQGASAPRVRGISSVVRALDVLADPWTYLILREAFFRVRRFEDFQRILGISRNVLAERLKRLIQDGVLKKQQYQDKPPRFEYRLTDSGRDFYPAIVILMAWGDRWRPSAEGAPLKLTHAVCGRRLNPTVVCRACKQPVSPFDVSFFPGPGAGYETFSEVPGTRRSRESSYIRGRPCSVARALEAIGDRWSFRILRESFLGVRRFEDLLRNLGVARNILTDRLARLVRDGILGRRRYQTRPDRYEYVLTQAGLDLYPSLLLLLAWGDRWRAPPKGPPLILEHKTCRSHLQPLLICKSCGAEVDVRDVRYKTRYGSNGSNMTAESARRSKPLLAQ